MSAVFLSQVNARAKSAYKPIRMSYSVGSAQRGGCRLLTKTAENNKVEGRSTYPQYVLSGKVNKLFPFRCLRVIHRNQFPLVDTVCTSPLSIHSVRSVKSYALTIGLVLAVIVSSVLNVPSTANASTTTSSSQNSSQAIVLTSGHTDAITVVPNGSTISLVSKEDVSHPGVPTYHNPARIVFGVKDAAFTEKTEQLQEIGIGGYALPQTQDANLLWPGWDSLALSELNAGNIRYNITDITGPGAMYLWQTANFGETKPVLDSGAYRIEEGESFHQTIPAHTHANWLFTKPGEYTLTIVVKATTPSGELVSEPASYIFAVGKDAISKYSQLDDAVSSASNSPSDQTQGAEARKLDGELREAGKLSSQAAPSQCIPQRVGVARGGSGSTAVGGVHTIPANTHVHPNWVFTAPGRYRVQITQTATSRSGQKVSVTGVLSFNVGGAGNANSGHFDVGTGISGKRLAMLVKDDRTQPAKWVSPNNLVFGVSGAARTVAPSGIEFIASEGTPIWMISSTQVQGVPWIGANTQHPDLLRSTTGAVTWRLDAVDGPGALAVFESGNFGKVVGARWFGGASSSSSSSITQWIGRTASGEPCKLNDDQIREIEASGGVVVDDSRLASTGSLALSIVIAAVGLLLLGFALLIHRRKVRR